MSITSITSRRSDREVFHFGRIKSIFEIFFLVFFGQGIIKFLNFSQNFVFQRKIVLNYF